MTFHDDEHRINNTRWIRNGDGTEEWNEKQNHWENAERFSIYIFLHQYQKQCLEFALAKLRRICKYLADAYNSNSHVCGLHCLTFVCENKAGKSTQWGESSLKNALKRAQRYLTQKCGEVSLQNEIATLPPKNHDLFVKQERKGKWKNKENAATG